MSDKNQHKKPLKRGVILTEEQKAQALADLNKRQADEKAERQRVELYGRSLPKLSHNQLRKELVKTIKREYSGKPPQPQAGLTIALASILLTVLENTNTPQNPQGKLHSYPR